MSIWICSMFASDFSWKTKGKLWAFEFTTIEFLAPSFILSSFCTILSKTVAVVTFLADNWILRKFSWTQLTSYYFSVIKRNLESSGCQRFLRGKASPKTCKPQPLFHHKDCTSIHFKIPKVVPKTTYVLFRNQNQIVFWSKW